MKQAPICGLFGRRGVGKTTLARAIARHQARLVVWDYIGEYGPLAFRSEGNPAALEEYLRWARGQRFAAARYIPREGTVEEFEEWCAVVFGFRDCVVVVEEVAAVAQASWLPPAFGGIVRQGRHRGLGLLWTAQRLNEVSRTLTSLTDFWAGFSLSEPADLQALAQRCGRDYAERVSKLPRFEWAGFDVDTQETFADADRLKALWGAPHEWRFPVSQGSAETRKPLRIPGVPEGALRR
jgi:DNA helicase HerA-like ATPase